MKSITSAKRKRLVIALEPIFDVIGGYERGQGSSRSGLLVSVRMPESTVWNIVKHAEEMKNMIKL
jgi:hypothetical protein